MSQFVALVRDAAATEAETRPLLIFDQFEELVTLFEEALPGESVKDALTLQDEIITALVDLLRDQTLPVKLLFVFREDYLAKLTKLFQRYPDLPDQYVRITPVKSQLILRLIRGPFDKYPGHFAREIPEALARRIMQAIEDRGAPAVNLSEVQIVCWQLWHSERPEALFDERRMGGILELLLGAA